MPEAFWGRVFTGTTRGRWHVSGLLRGLGLVLGVGGLAGADAGFLGGQPLGLVQRLLDQAQDELPLGVLPAGAGALPLQVGLDPLEEVLGDLECHRSGVIVRHGHVTSTFFHFEIFDQQVRDVLCGGQARLLSGLAYPIVEVQGDLSTEVLRLCHFSVLLSVFVP